MCAARNEILQSGSGFDPGDGSGQIGAKVLMGANEVRDPGDGGGQRWKWKEVRWLNVEVKQELDDVWRGAGLKLLDLLLHDAELVMLMSGLLRFVTAGCRRTPKTSSEYG